MNLTMDQPIGEVIGIRGQARAVSDKGARELEQGDSVYQGEQIVTSEDSSVEIRFLDGTLLSQGPDSILSLDEYIFDPGDMDSSVLSFGFLQGAFRQVTGRIAEENPERVEMESPLSIIGIRGTTTVHLVGREMESHGVEDISSGYSVVVQDSFNEIRVLTQPRLMLDVYPDRPMGFPRPMTQEELEFFWSISPAALEEQGLEDPSTDEAPPDEWLLREPPDEMDTGYDPLSSLPESMHSQVWTIPPRMDEPEGSMYDLQTDFHQLQPPQDMHHAGWADDYIQSLLDQDPVTAVAAMAQREDDIQDIIGEPDPKTDPDPVPDPEPDPDPEPEPAFFTILSFPDIEAGFDETITVSALIENTGEEPGSQTITLDLAGQEGEWTQDLTLEGGQSEGVNFELGTLALDPGDYTLTLDTQDDTQSATLTVMEPEPEPAFFEVVDIGTAEVEEGETATLTATIENTGELEGTQDVSLSIRGYGGLLTESLTLDPGDTSTVDFSIDTAEWELEAGTYTVEVSTDDHNDISEAALTVTAPEPDPEPAFFEVTNIGTAEVEEGETATLTTTIQNTGEMEGKATASLSIEGYEFTLTESLALEAGDDTTIDFSIDTDAWDLGAGTYTVEVSTDDHSLISEAALTVTEPEPEPDWGEGNFFHAHQVRITQDGEEEIVQEGGSAEFDYSQPAEIVAYIENTGQISNTQDIRLEIGEDEWVQEAELDPGESDEVVFDFEAGELEFLSEGEHELVLSTQDDELQASLEAA